MNWASVIRTERVRVRGGPADLRRLTGGQFLSQCFLKMQRYRNTGRYEVCPDMSPMQYASGPCKRHRARPPLGERSNNARNEWDTWRRGFN